MWRSESRRHRPGINPGSLTQVPQQRTIQSLLLRWRQVRPHRVIDITKQ